MTKKIHESIEEFSFGEKIMTGFIDGVCFIFKVKFILFYEDLQNGTRTKFIEEVGETGSNNGLWLRRL